MLSYMEEIKNISIFLLYTRQMQYKIFFKKHDFPPFITKFFKNANIKSQVFHYFRCSWTGNVEPYTVVKF